MTDTPGLGAPIQSPPPTKEGMAKAGEEVDGTTEEKAKLGSETSLRNWGQLGNTGAASPKRSPLPANASGRWAGTRLRNGLGGERSVVAPSAGRCGT